MLMLFKDVSGRPLGNGRRVKEKHHKALRHFVFSALNFEQPEVPALMI